MVSPIAEQEERKRRDQVVGASVNGDEELEIVEAFAQAGFKVKSQAARVILLGFVRDVKVRDAVARFIRDNPVVLKD